MKKRLLLFQLLLLALPLASVAQRLCFDRAPSGKQCFQTDPFKEIITEEDSLLHRLLREHKLKTVTAMMKGDETQENKEGLYFHWKKEYDRFGRLMLDSTITRSIRYFYDDKSRITGITSVVNGEEKSRNWKYDGKGYISSYTETRPSGRTVVKYIPGKKIREEIVYDQKNAVTWIRIDSLDNYRHSKGYIIKDGSGKVIERSSGVKTEELKDIPYHDPWEERRALAGKTEFRVIKNKDGSRVEDIVEYDSEGNPKMQTVEKYDSLDRLISWEVYGFTEEEKGDYPLGGGPNFIRNNEPDRKGYYKYHWSGMVVETKTWNSKGAVVDEFITESGQDGYPVIGKKKWGDKTIEYHYSYTFYP